MDINFDNVKVIPNRLAYMRNLKGLTQKDFASALAEYEYKKGGNPNTPSNVSVSQWEIGSKPVPTKYVEGICHVLGCTEAFLYGYAHTPYSSEPDTDDTFCPPQPSTDPIDPIYFLKYDGFPVFVEFKKYQHENGWGIFNIGADRLMLKDAVIKLSSLNFEDVSFFPLWQKRIANAKRLDLGYALRSEYVFIVMNSPDKSIRDMYNGIYHHNENKTCFINGRGFCLPYDGINLTYYVYDKDPETDYWY